MADPLDATAAPDQPAPASRVDRLISVLARVVPWARWVRGAVTVLAAASAAAVALLAVAAATTGPSLSTGRVLALLVLVAILLLPAVALLGLRLLLTTVVELPARLASEPGLRRDQAVRLASPLRSGDAAAGTSAPTRGWRAARLLLSARGDLLQYGLLLRLLSVPYLLVCAVAAVAAVLEVVVLPPVALAMVLLG